MSERRQLLVELTPDAANKFDEMQTRLKAEDDPGIVIAKAFELLDVVTKHEAEGGLIFCKKADGSAERIIV